MVVALAAHSDQLALVPAISVPGDVKVVATIRPVGGKALDVGPDTNCKSE